MSLIRQVEQATQAWATKGNKAGRARQRRMMMAFAGHAEALGARERGQVGGRTVISYFKALRAAKRAYATQMDHWRAIRELWQLWGKPGEPPRPREPGEQPAGGAAPQRAGGRRPTGGRGAAGPAVGGPVRPPQGGT